MGLGQSRARRDAALSVFSPNEQAYLKELCTTLTPESSDKIAFPAFIKFCEVLPEPERKHLFRAMVPGARGGTPSAIDMTQIDFLTSIHHAARGTVIQQARFMFNWCSRGAPEVSLQRIHVFVRLLASVALGIHPLKSKDKFCYAATPAIVNALLHTLDEEVLPQLEDSPSEEVQTFGCCAPLAMGRSGLFESKSRKVNDEREEDPDHIHSSEESQDTSARTSERSRLLTERKLTKERKESLSKSSKPEGQAATATSTPAGSKERKKSKSRRKRYNSFDRKTAGVDGDVEEDLEDSENGSLASSRKPSRLPDILDEDDTMKEERKKKIIKRGEFIAWAILYPNVLLLVEIIMQRTFLRPKEIWTLAGQHNDQAELERGRKWRRERGLNMPILSYHTRLLSTEDTWWLNLQLPAEARHHWRLLFSEAVHGKSWAKFLGNIEKQGPTLIVIQDTHNRVFGGFASTSWVRDTGFYGEHSSFLFTLRPAMAGYFPSQFNEHFQFLTSSTSSAPSGLGMGGELNSFGLFLDASFESGHSCAGPLCTTFNSPRLSQDENFKIKFVEVWGVVPSATSQPVKE